MTRPVEVDPWVQHIVRGLAQHACVVLRGFGDAHLGVEAEATAAEAEEVTAAVKAVKAEVKALKAEAKEAVG